MQPLSGVCWVVGDQVVQNFEMKLPLWESAFIAFNVEQHFVGHLALTGLLQFPFKTM